MTISTNYPHPVYVNGYACNNCAQVAEAKQDINPADPKAGPGGIDADTASDPTSTNSAGASARKAAPMAGTGALVDVSV